MIRSSFVITLVATLVLLGTASMPGTPAAQDATVHSSAAATLPAGMGASVSATRAGADAAISPSSGPWVATVAFPTTHPATDVAAAYRDDPHLGAGKHRAMMGVGAAAIGLGLPDGDDAGTAIAGGGGLLGLYGFYKFLR